MLKPRLVAPFLTVVVLSSATVGAAGDTAAARMQFEKGYALREQGKCDEAILHLKESVRLDPTNPKVFMNMADCEERLGRLSAAEADFVSAKNLAHAQHLDDVFNEAERRIARVESRMPKLSIRLATDAPADTIVIKDGVELGRISLGTPLPTDPGSHTILARSGTTSKSYDLSLAEGESKQIEVSPGIPTAGPSERHPVSVHPNPTPAASASTSFEQVQTEPAEGVGSRVPTIVAGGVGLAGAAVGIIFGLKAMSKSNDAENACPAAGCPNPAHAAFESLREDATRAKTTATIGFLVGGVGFLTAAALILTGGSPSRSEPTVSLGLGGNHADVMIQGRW